MPNIYCDACGQAHLAEIAATDMERFPREYIRIARGSLAKALHSGSYCDGCNTILHDGELVVHIAGFPLFARDDDTFEHRTLLLEPEVRIFAAKETLAQLEGGRPGGPEGTTALGFDWSRG